MLRAALVATLLLGVLLAGCTGPGQDPVQSASPQGVPDRLLVRMFMEDMDGDGVEDLVIRLAAFAPPEQVQPFRGELLVMLSPDSADSSWVPRVWVVNVTEKDFIAGELPYYQVQAPAGFLARGESVLVEAEATLLNGRVLRGAFETSA